MQFRINLDYKRPAAKEGEGPRLSDAELTQNYIDFAVNQKYPSGLEGSLRRTFGRIQRKLDEAIDNKQDSVELDQSEADFLFKAFTDVKFQPALSKFVIVLEDYLDEVRKQS